MTQAERETVEKARRLVFLLDNLAEENFPEMAKLGLELGCEESARLIVALADRPVRVPDDPEMIEYLISQTQTLFYPGDAELAIRTFINSFNAELARREAKPAFVDARTYTDFSE